MPSLDLARSLLDEMWRESDVARREALKRRKGTTTRINDTWSKMEHAMPEDAARLAVDVLARRGIHAEDEQRWYVQLLLRVEADPSLDWPRKLRRLEHYLLEPLPFPARRGAEQRRRPRRPPPGRRRAAPAAGASRRGSASESATPPRRGVRPEATGAWESGDWARQARADAAQTPCGGGASPYGGSYATPAPQSEPPLRGRPPWAESAGRARGGSADTAADRATTTPPVTDDEASPPAIVAALSFDRGTARRVVFSPTVGDAAGARRGAAGPLRDAGAQTPRAARESPSSSPDGGDRSRAGPGQALTPPRSSRSRGDVSSLGRGDGVAEGRRPFGVDSVSSSLWRSSAIQQSPMTARSTAARSAARDDDDAPALSLKARYEALMGPSTSSDEDEPTAAPPTAPETVAAPPLAPPLAARAAAAAARATADEDSSSVSSAGSVPLLRSMRDLAVLRRCALALPLRGLVAWRATLRKSRARRVAAQRGALSAAQATVLADATEAVFDAVLLARLFEAWASIARRAREIDARWAACAKRRGFSRLVRRVRAARARRGRAAAAAAAAALLQAYSRGAAARARRRRVLGAVVRLQARCRGRRGVASAGARGRAAVWLQAWARSLAKRRAYLRRRRRLVAGQALARRAAAERRLEAVRAAQARVAALLRGGSVRLLRARKHAAAASLQALARAAAAARRRFEASFAVALALQALSRRRAARHCAARRRTAAAALQRRTRDRLVYRRTAATLAGLRADRQAATLVQARCRARLAKVLAKGLAAELAFAAAVLRAHQRRLAAQRRWRAVCTVVVCVRRLARGARARAAPPRMQGLGRAFLARRNFLELKDRCTRVQRTLGRGRAARAAFLRARAAAIVVAACLRRMLGAAAARARRRRFREQKAGALRLWAARRRAVARLAFARLSAAAAFARHLEALCRAQLRRARNRALAAAIASWGAVVDRNDARRAACPRRLAAWHDSAARRRDARGAGEVAACFLAARRARTCFAALDELRRAARIRLQRRALRRWRDEAKTRRLLRGMRLRRLGSSLALWRDTHAARRRASAHFRRGLQQRVFREWWLWCVGPREVLRRLLVGAAATQPRCLAAEAPRAWGARAADPHASLASSPDGRRRRDRSDRRRDRSSSASSRSYSDASSSGGEGASTSSSLSFWKRSNASSRS